jgi:peptidyl-prolyl cis-trans isomerase D
MFDTVRNNSKIMMGLLFVLIIPSFVLFGMEGYTRFNEQATAVAKVDGEKITQQQWDAAHQREVDRIRAQMPGMDPKLLDSSEARKATLDRLLNDKVVSAAARELRLVTSDARLARELQQDPAIASLRGPDGRLDMERYRQLLTSQGMSPEMFEANVRADLSNRQVLQSLQGSALAGRSQTEAAVNAYFQRREVQLQLYKTADYMARVQITEEALSAFYEANPDRFRSTETADVEYVVLDVAAVEKSIVLAESDLRSYYEQNMQKLASQEQRRASHILITAAKDAPAVDRQKAREKAQGLLESVRKKPDSFASVARSHSQDPGSASRGGDLDFFARGAMVKPFEEAVFGLQKGQISDVVESDFGFHIIVLTDIKAPKVESFESMRPRLEAELRKQQAQRKVAELAETFSNTVYEQADSLKPVAEKLRLSVQQATGLSRQPGQGLPGVLGNPKLLQALFSDDAISKRRNTEAVEVAPNTLVSARIVAHRPSAVRPLAQVRDEVRSLFQQNAAAKLAAAHAKQNLSGWQAQPAQAALGPAVTVSREQTQGIPSSVLDAALRADPSKLPSLVGVDLGDAGYALVRVNKVMPRDTQTPEQIRQTRAQFANLWGQAETQAYLTALKSRYDAQLMADKSRGVTPGTEK